jgi:hypothetical protein
VAGGEDHWLEECSISNHPFRSLGAIIARMKAWLFAEGLSEQTAFAYHLVFSRPQAAELTEHDAHEVIRGAERDFPGYRWTMVNVPGSAFFLVEGDEKKK